jgi:hypothetical protein
MTRPTRGFVFGLLALGLGPSEHELLVRGLVAISAISLSGYALYTFVHVLQENWPRFGAGCTAIVDFYFDRLEQVARRRAQLRRIRRQLEDAGRLGDR